VKGSGSQGAGVSAGRSPHAHVKVEGVARGGISSGNVKPPGFNGAALRVHGVPLRHVLLFGARKANAVLPRVNAPVAEAVVSGINKPVALAFDSMLAATVQRGSTKGAVRTAVLAGGAFRAQAEQQRSRRLTRKCMSGRGLAVVSGGGGSKKAPAPGPP